MTQTQDSDVVFDQFARITGALSAPSRLKLFDRLAQGEQTVEQLSEASGLSISNTSRHLRVLAEARLVLVRRDSPHVYYRIASDEVLRFWFALRDLSRSQLAELNQIAADLIETRDGLAPVTREELLARLSTGEVVLLDVRPGPEYRAGHIPGALNLPLAELEGHLEAIASGRQVVAYCRGPYCMLAVDAVAALRARGFSALRLEDGFPEWKAAGLPIQTN